MASNTLKHNHFRSDTTQHPLQGGRRGHANVIANIFIASTSDLVPNPSEMAATDGNTFQSVQSRSQGIVGSFEVRQRSIPTSDIMLGLHGPCFPFPVPWRHPQESPGHGGAGDKLFGVIRLCLMSASPSLLGR